MPSFQPLSRENSDISAIALLTSSSPHIFQPSSDAIELVGELCFQMDQMITESLIQRHSFGNLEKSNNISRHLYVNQ